MKLENLTKKQLIAEYKKLVEALLKLTSSSLEALGVEEEPNVIVGALNG